VACCDIQEDAGAALVAELGSNAIFFKLDVKDYDEQAKVFSQVWGKWKRLDALLANAGHSDRGSIYILNHRGKTEIPPKPALLSLKACYESFLYGVQLAIHFMRMNDVPGGQIIATSTIASIHPHQTFPEYCGAKAAVSSFNFTYHCGCPRLSFPPVIGKDQSVRANSSTGSKIGNKIRIRGVNSMLTVLQKDNITLNAVLPGIVATGAVPQASLDATDPAQ
jgi:NAD(P)-dependent dehydrogenase (short-subunit alcohol dehydrogenase family)